MESYTKDVLVFSPFYIPDVKLALKTIEAGAFPVLYLNQCKETSENALKELSEKTDESFGVYISLGLEGIKLPKNVTRVILPIGSRISVGKGVEVLFQAYSPEDVSTLISQGVSSIIIKGNEAGGKVANESSFILFQKVVDTCKKKNVKLYVQGGVGVHTSAAFLALGAQGVVLDSQVATFPECSAPMELKNICKKLNGNETVVIDGFRVLHRTNSPKLPENPKAEDLYPFLGGYDLSENYLPMGQDITLSVDYLNQYKNLKNLIFAIHEAAYGHLRQAKSLTIIGENSEFAKDLGVKYPITQGPMARISDTPEFISNVADEGAMPFLALSLMTGEPCRNLLKETSERLKDRPWGVGILGFISPQMLEEQTGYIIESKPKVVLIAGGRPSLAAPFEKEGIKVLLHVPSVSLLDMFLKEGAKHFIFEGRESGGHVGPIMSLVLWEKQINRLLKEDNQSLISVLFAGGIHDSLSSAFVGIMAATLAAKGVKVGVQMGTSYLYTKEAVKSGAIQSEYQKQIIEKNETILLEAALGQETRAVETPFTEFFQKEKQKMLDGGMDAKEAWMKLEELNLGRSRIAAKGMERKNGKLVKLSNEEQIEKGLYMTGAVTSLLHKPLTMKTLHKRVAVDNNELIRQLKDIEIPDYAADPMDIAIVGMECIFPDAKNKDEYWKNLFIGKDTITEVPDTRWNKEVFYKPDVRDTDYSTSKWGGFIPTIDFDPVEFGITPQSLSSIEPVQLLSLYVAKRALEDAGYSDLSAVDLDNTSVFFGAEGATDLAYTYMIRSGLMQLFGKLPDEVDEAMPKLTEDSFPGVLSNVIAGRIANRLNLGGRNYTVDAACASSLAAMDVACQELVSNRSDMVIAGGADFHNGINDYLMFSSTYALSKKGKPASFSNEADGIVLGEGIGVVVLKRLKDAKRDGNKIYAVIKAIEGSSDGRSLGLTAPNRKGQINALARTYRRAGILPSQVGFVEAHGTGTVVGDKTELSALTDIFVDTGALTKQTYLGSVKTQIGHTKCAAGIAGLIKATLAVQQGIIPPISHMNHPNGYYNENSNPFVFNTNPALWKSEKRIAGVSAFGFGGTNFHIVLENYPENKANEKPPLEVWPSELFVFWGATMDDAKGQMQKIKDLLTLNDNIALKDIAYMLAVYSKENIQISIVAGSVEELLKKIDIAKENKRDLAIFYREAKDGKVAFLFSGQGSQRINMGLDLFAAIPSMRRLLKENPQYEEILFPHTAFNEEAKKRQQTTITDTRNAQPLLGIIDFAIAEYLQSLGIKPDMVAGHSYGEVAALCFAGAFAPENLVSLSRERAQAILDAIEEDKGKMAAISNVPEAELKELLAGETEVWAVNYNSPKQIVLAGTSNGITEFVKKVTEKGIACKEINVACAFHSPLLAKSKELYADVLKKITFKKPKIQVWSNTTAEIYPTKGAEIKARLSEHLVQPVLFSKQLENMYNAGARIFIETGPGRVLTGLAQNTLADDIVAIQTENKGSEGITYLLKALGQYLATGKEFNLEKLFENRNVSTIDIDNIEQYKKKSTIWFINGQNAIPSDKKMLSGDIYPITKIFSNNMGKDIFSGNANPDKVMLEYLDSLKKMIENQREMIQNQRDVMLGYFGQYEPVQRTAMPRYQNPIILEDAPQAAIEEGEAVQLSESTVTTLNIASLTTDQLKEIVLEVVSDKTGYPPEMLDMDMDMEADLSIDSIKRMEIIGGLREKLTFPERLAEIEGIVEKMAAIKTLRNMIAWIEELGQMSFDSVPAKAEQTTDEDKTKEVEITDSNIIPVDETELARLCFELKESPISKEDVLSIEGNYFALTDDGGENPYAVTVKELLEKQGAKVDLITKETTDLSAYDGLIVMNISSSPERYTVEHLFKFLKAGDMNRLRSIFSFSDLMSKVLNGKKIKDLSDIQGFPGLIKSLMHEYPDINFRVVGSHTPFDITTLPQIILDELSVKEKFPEVIYKNQERFQFDIKAEEVKINGEPILDIDENSVVLVLGGAQGITPELVSQLSLDYPCTYILAGRSSQLEDSEKYSSLQTRDEIRKYLISEENMKVPADIEKRLQVIYKSNQIGQAIEKIKAAGGKAVYKTVDAKNSKEFKAFINALKKEYGKIDGVIHAAGILDDKLFADKTWESFENVYQTKVNPLEVIVNALLPNLKFLVMFSSVSSAFGNRGQCDYAAGNSVFDLLSIILLEKKIPTRVLSFNWGPWKGAGMVSDLLENEFRKRGVGMIPLKEGGEFFVKELKYGKEPAVLAMGGNASVIENFLKGQA
ncbi:acyl transferase domain-containing protein/NAD(P)H-dependent flavin oxidoreductase YrpB (nitropropane dioxygenase family)/NAD(P)-dependent dehydrogenase (short-subunit alcohol dehydrogenase family)/acyl carrier protein [Parabacteroides sp. PF5-5]|uniref:type I polyketide synthase n=1 Tax=unclassified Parabacteroides TaxID=2649774 RepID=UPI0024742ACA|nr:MULTISPECIES: type I polyketide synthase [unclassified Parabacteroides]MDH6306519.1 acyl transferase domain-containing protein/NAD(P)H-dependent flavin oxidoreductase YrpB (nitropropane dioxygenase family)/NAD(P)-dependent dehydrogenase (short-subunit alcohol dehydrogenase family)/acyl carrier protein [Parabacteroides sp. PH5-39]MDH6317486.1 acyl transferase domain-containing protein/NAD(P)H-dependent flavin oxidoreductase YrpB (nitropropane dioxygenase family)/NAD(P)-dependent dehydrogenase (